MNTLLLSLSMLYVLVIYAARLIYIVENHTWNIVIRLLTLIEHIDILHILLVHLILIEFIFIDYN